MAAYALLPTLALPERVCLPGMASRSESDCGRSSGGDKFCDMPDLARLSLGPSVPSRRRSRLAFSDQGLGAHQQHASTEHGDQTDESRPRTRRRLFAPADLPDESSVAPLRRNILHCSGSEYGHTRKRVFDDNDGRETETDLFDKRNDSRASIRLARPDVRPVKRGRWNTALDPLCASSVAAAAVQEADGGSASRKRPRSPPTSKTPCHSPCAHRHGRSTLDALQTMLSTAITDRRQTRPWSAYQSPPPRKRGRYVCDIDLLLPDEMLLAIMRACDRESLGRLACTCVRMALLSRDPVLWRAIYLRDFPPCAPSSVGRHGASTSNAVCLLSAVDAWSFDRHRAADDAFDCGSSHRGRTVSADAAEQCVQQAVGRSSISQCSHESPVWSADSSTAAAGAATAAVSGARSIALSDMDMGDMTRWWSARCMRQSKITIERVVRGLPALSVHCPHHPPSLLLARGHRWAYATNVRPTVCKIQTPSGHLHRIVFRGDDPNGDGLGVLYEVCARSHALQAPPAPRASDWDRRSARQEGDPTPCQGNSLVVRWGRFGGGRLNGLGTCVTGALSIPHPTPTSVSSDKVDTSVYGAAVAHHDKNHGDDAASTEKRQMGATANRGGGLYTMECVDSGLWRAGTAEGVSIQRRAMTPVTYNVRPGFTLVSNIVV